MRGHAVGPRMPSRINARRYSGMERVSMRMALVSRDDALRMYVFVLVSPRATPL